MPNNVVKSKLVGIMLNDMVVGTWLKLNSSNSFIVIVCWFGQHNIVGIVLFLIAVFTWHLMVCMILHTKCDQRLGTQFLGQLSVYENT